MLKEAINRILELAPIEDRIAVINNRSYVQSGKDFIPIRDPLCETVRMNTLTGLIDFVKDVRNPQPQMILIKDESIVQALGEIREPWRAREAIALAHWPEEDQFPYGSYKDIEEFIIKLGTRFVRTEELKKLMDVVSHVTGDLVTTAEDDGVAQTVTVKDAVGRLSDKEQKPIWKLRPYRTFRELMQPECDMLLRFQRKKGELPRVALFDADGGTWRIGATYAIREFLKASIPPELGITIVA
jgi:hypothetical protein